MPDARKPRIPLRLVKTVKGWRFGPWPISYGWGFDLGRYRLVWGRDLMKCVHGRPSSEACPECALLSWAFRWAAGRSTDA